VKWRQKLDHTKEWWVRCWAVKVGTVSKPDLDAQKIRDWADAPDRLDNPNRLQAIDCDMSPADDLDAVGLEPLPTEEP